MGVLVNDSELEIRTANLIAAMDYASPAALVAMMLRLDQRMLELGWVRPAGGNRATRRARSRLRG